MDKPSLKYPIYIVSKGRWERPLTARFLIKDGIDFKIAVEPQEYEKYCESLGERYVLKLPFSNLGLGSYPARNYVWEHSMRGGHKRHFVFDDNIYGFNRMNKGLRKSCHSYPAFKTLEEFTDRFDNVAISGFNYSCFATRNTRKPFYLNAHVYSGILINNEIPYRWRLKYNEDVDLCLQALHNKWCTILLNAFLIKKVSTTAKMKGGNQDELYKNNDHHKKMLKTKSLEVMWPKYVRTIFRFGRPHHQISWGKHFRQPLKEILRQPSISSSSSHIGGSQPSS